MTGELETATILNAQIRDNMLALGVAKVTTAGDMLYATGANALARLAAGTSSQYLLSGATPSWTSGVFMYDTDTGAVSVVASTIGASPVSGQIGGAIPVSAVGASFTGYVQLSGGGAAIISATYVPNTSTYTQIYTDGTNILQAYVDNVGGILFKRSAGTQTFDVALIMVYR